jgi:hypothetical protein
VPKRSRLLMFYFSMPIIPLTRGQVAIVDDEDLDCVSRFSWQAYPKERGNRTYYYAKARLLIDGRKRLVSMQRFLMDYPQGLVVDHKNHDTLDNRRSNLRVCTRSQNQGNALKRPGTRFKGVSREHTSKRWKAVIQCENRTYRIGTFEREDEAASAYNKKAIELFGEFACVI